MYDLDRKDLTNEEALKNKELQLVYKMNEHHNESILNYSMAGEHNEHEYLFMFMVFRFINSNVQK